METSRVHASEALTGRLRVHAVPHLGDATRRRREELRADRRNNRVDAICDGRALVFLFIL